MKNAQNEQLENNNETTNASETENTTTQKPKESTGTSNSTGEVVKPIKKTEKNPKKKN